MTLTDKLNRRVEKKKPKGMAHFFGNPKPPFKPKPGWLEDDNAPRWNVPGIVKEPKP